MWLSGQHRGVLAPERLVGFARALADDLVEDHLTVLGHHRAAHALGGDAAELRRRAVGGPIGARRQQTRTQPVGADPAEGQRLVFGGEQQDEAAVAVEPAGRVGHLAGSEQLGNDGTDPSLALPGLPHERRASGVDPDPLHGRVDVEPNRVAGEGVLEPDVERVTGCQRLGREALHTGEPGTQVVPHVHVAVLAVGRQRRGDPRRHDRGVGECGEHLRVADRSRGGDLGAGRDRDGLGTSTGAPERQVGPRGRGRELLEAQQVEHARVEHVRRLVQPVQHRLGHPGEQLDQRHAGVGQVVVGPFRTQLRNHPLGLVDEVLELAIVEVGDGETHGSSSRGIT